MVCLLVGEGDFSYALALARERDPVNLVASCLFTHGHGRLDVRANVDKLSAMGVRVLMDVDARRLHEHPWVSRCAELSEIVFNFPHVGGKMKIDENRKLLRDFFISAGLVLRPGSLVQVTLCRGQGGTPAESHVRCPGDTWQVVEMAAPGGFILHQVLPFRAPAGYTPRGYRGGAKGFHIEGALTHVFCLVGSAVPVLPSADWSIPGTEQDTVAKRLRSTMTAEETPLGGTLHCVASALGLAVGDLVASWAAQEDGCNTSGDATWRCRLERPHACSSTKPPVGHILDVSIRDTSRMRDVLRLLREICGNSLTFPTLPCMAGFRDTGKRLETGGCCVCCKDLHVATFAYQTPASIGCENVTVPLNSRISFNSSIEENSCALQTETSESDLLSDCFSSLQLEDYKLAYCGLPCKVSLHIEALSLAFHNLSDWRLLLPQPDVKPLFRTASFTHDLSFWLGEGFDEDDFLAFIYSKAGELLQSIDLVDDYVDARTGRCSRCYRLCYQSLWKSLSREAARDFHMALGEAVGRVLPVKVR